MPAPSSLPTRITRRGRRFVKELQRSAKGYPNRSRYPWYDQQWLLAYGDAKTYLENQRPDRLAEFEETLAVFRTDLSFSPVLIDDFYDEEMLGRVRRSIEEYDVTQLEKHELAQFGRDVVHDHPLFVQLQHDAVDKMSEVVGEPVEACYNFLSLYQSDGSCALHMDSPSAKWTLDICVEQSRPWPIHLSELVPWPEDWTGPAGGDWQTAIKNAHQFESLAMEPGQAIAFAGSSQWHYRDPMENAVNTDFCTLLFFHFVPMGTSEFVYPAQWGKKFDVPELTEVIRRA